MSDTTTMTCTARSAADESDAQQSDTQQSHARHPSLPTSSGTALTLDPERMRESLGRLVLTLVEFLRRLLEMQAMRRMDKGSLSDAEIERVGLALARLAEEMAWLKAQFGLADEDLNLDLGPLGKLL